MARPLRRGALLAGLAAACLAAGCGSGSGDVEGPVAVYVSLPLTGPAGADGRDAADGARLALELANGKAGSLEVEATYLDDAKGNVWDPVAVGANARAAAQDSSTAAYIGELDSEPTRASVPITNQAGIVQVSPGASGVDLTRPAEGYPDSPDRYQPSGSATFARVIPADDEQASGLAQWAADLRLTSVAALPAKGPFGELMLSEFTTDAEEAGVEVTQAASRESEATFEAGGAPAGPGLLTGPGAERFTSGAIVADELPPGDFPAQFSKRFGREPGPYAAYGYEAMEVVLAGIDRASDSDEFRSSIVDGVLDSEHPDSVLGTYSITAEGDTTLCAIQRYELRGEAVPAGADCPPG